MIFTTLIRTREGIDANKPNICVEIFQDGVEDSYKLLTIDHSKLSAPQKTIYNNLVNAILANSDEEVSDCSGNFKNAPTFDNNNISISISQNGEYTGFCPCEIDYKKMKASDKNKISSFVDLIKQLIN